MTARIANTFVAVTRLADFKATRKPEKDKKGEGEKNDAEKHDDAGAGKIKGLRTEFHYNIQVVLPSNGTEEVYLNIFNAIRKTFQ